MQPMRGGPIIIIDDDEDDRALLVNSVGSTSFANQLRIFKNGADALTYLAETTDQPFIILCDIKMPRMDGLELQEAISKNERLRKKSIPFVFVTGSADKAEVERAYYRSVQGFFTKPTSVEEWHDLIEMVLRYWAACRHPNA